MSISVLAPVSPAIERTRQVLFKPFDLAKWVMLGFCAWLAQFGGGGGFSFPTQFNVRMPFPGQGGAAGPPGQQGPPPLEPVFRGAWNWVQAHANEVMVGVAVVALVGLVFGLVVLWLKARGIVLFLDGVVRDRGSVAEPWREYAAEGNSLFRFLVAYSVVMFLVSLLIIALGVGIALPDIRALKFGDHALSALLATVPLFVLTGLAAGVVQVFLYDFVVPILYLRRQGVSAAWGEFGRSILAGRVGTLVLYLLFKVVLGIAAGLIAMLLTCATCCIAGLPFVGTVILLPVSVFFRTYSLLFLEQFGREWSLFPAGNKPGDLIFDDLPPPRI